MQVHTSLATLRRDAPIALTIGAFDGLHLGHQHLVRQVCAAAARIGGQCGVLTFDPHPDLILRSERERLYLSTPLERARVLEELGVDHLIVLRFDRDLAAVPAETFMSNVAQACNLRELWLGPDARLGAGGRGTVPVLQGLGAELGYVVHVVEPLRLHGQAISSTAIREMLGAGDVDGAARLLSRPYSLAGEVVHGDHRGRTIGFPTANIAVPAQQVLPLDGVYACQVQLPGESRTRPAVTNIGVRPTFGALRRTVEAHLLDWSGDLYGANVRAEFIRRLRGEQKFAGIDALVAQIRADVVAARDVLEQRTPGVAPVVGGR